MTSKPLRSRAIAITDIVVGVVFGLLGLVNMLVFLTLSFRPPHQGLSAPFKILIVVAWVAGIGVFIMFLTRKRIAFYWPIAGLALMTLIGIIFFNVVAA